MNLFDNKTLAQIVTEQPSTAAIFEKYDLDFCCKGKRTLNEACAEDQAKLKNIEQELEKMNPVGQQVPGNDELVKMDLGELTAYIINKHHRYVNEQMPMILAHLQKVAEKHGERHSELYEILRNFTDVKGEMEQHMLKEEKILFPRIREINDASKTVGVGWIPDKYYISAPIDVMEQEHDRAGAILYEIRKLTGNYNPPENACTTYRLSFNELRDFELDLHQHVHLENNILFPRSMELQKKMNAAMFN
ncbi:MAG: iron-sulfur cluster repair di-iron protein [Bacteroidetes bacterium]|nr:iron-sulfur cluster repair di-iron protein [Bacteroidota bacterium]